MCLERRAMYRGYKIRLSPNETQRKYLFELFKIRKDLYNGALKLLNNFYTDYKKLIDPKEIRAFFNFYIGNRIEDVEKYPIATFKLIVNKAFIDFKNFMANNQLKVSYKSTLNTHQSIELNSDDFVIFNERLFIKAYSKFDENISGIPFSEKDYMPKGGPYYNPHLIHDGVDFYLSCSKNVPNVKVEKPFTEAIGIDVGIKNFCTLSNGVVFENINKQPEMRRLNEMANYYQSRMQSLRFLSIKKKIPLTNHYFRIHRAYLKVVRKIVRKRLDYSFQIVNYIINLNPEYVCIEDLKVKNLVHENSLSKYIFEATFRKFRSILEYKCKQHGIKVVVADRYYPSSKTCSNCGYIVNDLKLGDRVFICPRCKLEIDRDLNAAINLSKLSKRMKKPAVEHSRDTKNRDDKNHRDK